MSNKDILNGPRGWSYPTVSCSFHTLDTIYAKTVLDIGLLQQSKLSVGTLDIFQA